jgi:uncharacterized protein YdeI (YjbR/CyaY-like superfamily)
MKENKTPAKIVFFSNPVEFRNWLKQHHKDEKELIVGFHKVGTGKPSMTWSESVDQALCFGWIDGIRKSVNKDSYCIRFTPRKPKSNWSAVNIKKAEELIKKGLMQPAGMTLYKNRNEDKYKVYSYENKPTKLPDNYEKRFKANKKGWEFFKSQAPSYQRTIYYWILSAKKQETQLSRLKKVIRDSEQQKRII